uniref:Protein CUSTOS n=1 Tax=Steinernema glaseri TaxID=37863 RepID=A0A1I7YH11_9BILA
MSRFDRDSSKESPEQDVEATFQKLYNRYVKDAESSSSESSRSSPTRAPATIRKFVSHSEAEYSCEDEETESEEEEEEMVATAKAKDATPRASSEKEATPREKTPGRSRGRPRPDAICREDHTRRESSRPGERVCRKVPRPAAEPGESGASETVVSVVGA